MVPYAVVEHTLMTMGSTAACTPASSAVVAMRPRIVMLIRPKITQEMSQVLAELGWRRRALEVIRRLNEVWKARKRAKESDAVVNALDARIAIKM